MDSGKTICCCILTLRFCVVQPCLFFSPKVSEGGTATQDPEANEDLADRPNISADLFQSVERVRLQIASHSSLSSQASQARPGRPASQASRASKPQASRHRCQQSSFYRGSSPFLKGGTGGITPCQASQYPTRIERRRARFDPPAPQPPSLPGVPPSLPAS